MEHFVIIINGWKPLTIIIKSSILVVPAVLDPPLETEIGPLASIKLQCPFEILSTDFSKLAKTKGDYEYVFVVTDHFTRYVQAYTRNINQQNQQ